MIRANCNVYRGIVCFALIVCLAGAMFPGAAIAEGASPRLRLVDGSYISGKLLDSNLASAVRWQSPLFVEPVEFPLKRVSSLQYPSPKNQLNPRGAFSIELYGGDMLFGDLKKFSVDQIEIDSPDFGDVVVRTKSVRRIQKLNEQSDLIFHGPNGMEGWENTQEAVWENDSGSLVSRHKESEIHSVFELPPQVNIDLELSWTRRPDFVLELGSDGKKAKEISGFRLEVWGEDLVAVGETKGSAAIASLAKLGSGPGQISIRLYLDQARKKLMVFSPDGRTLADLSLPVDKKAKPRRGIRLLNKQVNLRLDRIRVSHWDGKAPQSVTDGMSVLHLADGSIIEGTVRGYAPAAKELILDENGTERRVQMSQVASIRFGEGVESPRSNVLAILHHGARVSGELTQVKKNEITLRSPVLSAPLSIPVKDLQSMIIVNHPSLPPSSEKKASEKSTAGTRTGTLRAEGTRLIGTLLDGQREGDASCLVWRPAGCSEGSALRNGASGRIVYRTRVAKNKAKKARTAPQVQPGVAVPAGNLGVFGFLIGGAKPTGQVKPLVVGKKLSLFLRTGDSIPCEVTEIDEKGLHFKTELSEASFVPHQQIKAVELDSYNRKIQVTKAKLFKLLTVPRMQKNSPPTHIIRSRDGDYLRGRLVAMDDQNIEFEVRLENKTIPRSELSRIIWLHEDELNPEEKGAEAEATLAGNIQALRRNGSRITFQPKELVSGKLSGTSYLLQECHVEVKDIDELLIGSEIRHASSEMAYQQWRLKHAIDPRFVTAGEGSPQRPAGTESAMVGQAAPDFKLDLLDGAEFRLSNQQGKIIVLDFWATWCGPCIQAMPIVDRTVAEFKDRGVELVSVNLREGSKEVKATLERMQLETTVAMDQDGVVAEKYGAKAIPQTVIIDRDGKVARVFVGGAEIEERIRDSLTKILDGSDLTETSEQE